MNRHFKHFALTALSAAPFLVACNAPKTAADGATGASPRSSETSATMPVSEPPVHQIPENRVHLIGGTPANAIPKAVAFRMSGNYAQNLPLNLNPDGTLASFPAPSDITPSSAPLPLEGGWWLDSRGVTSSTVFSRYTLEEYSGMKETPSPGVLLESIIPGAHVTQIEYLPMSPVEAQADTCAVNTYLRTHTYSISRP